MSLEENVLRLALAVEHLTAVIGMSAASQNLRAALPSAASDPVGDKTLTPAKPARKATVATPQKEEPLAVEQKPAGEVKYETLREAILKCAELKGNAATLAILGKFGAKSGKEVKLEDYAKALAACQAAIV